MSVVFPLDANTVRQYMDLTDDSLSTGSSKYSNTTIGSNIRASLSMLEGRTNRFLADRTQTLKFTTNGNPYVTIPGLRTATTVNYAGATMTADTTYWLIPDVGQTGVSAGVQLRGFGQGRQSYLSSPEWFDRNMDSPKWQAKGWSSLPNDLVIAGDWGYTTPPEDCVMAVKVLTAYLTKLADANSQGASYTSDGNVFDLSNWPDLVQQFVREWTISPGVGGA